MPQFRVYLIELMSNDDVEETPFTEFLRLDIFTLFPAWFKTPLEQSVIGRALEQHIINVNIHDIRAFTNDRHRVVDDYSYGGGGGMVLKAEPMFAAVEGVLDSLSPESKPAVILLTPQGRTFDHEKALELISQRNILLICGHYEGVDERIREHLVTDEISIGDYVLSGGEAAAMVLIEAVGRLAPGVLGNRSAAEDDSFATGLLEHPHYTRPEVFRNLEVPEVLLSGDHERIARWRRKESLRRTLLRRPDLLTKFECSPEDQQFLKEIKRESLERETSEE